MRGPIIAAFDDDPGDGTGAILGFIGGDAALHWAALPPDQRRQTSLECFARWFGPAALQPTAFGYHDWTEERFTGGAPVAVPRRRRSEPRRAGVARAVRTYSLGRYRGRGEMDRVYGWRDTGRGEGGGGGYGQDVRKEAVLFLKKRTKKTFVPRLKQQIGCRRAQLSPAQE